MVIKYEHAPDIHERAFNIAAKLGMKHDFSRIKCIRSRGSQSARTLARCYALPRIMQLALGVEAHYVIEVISERFDNASNEDQSKIIIHELMHIPARFGGGFRYHDYVSRKNVDKMYKMIEGSM